MAYADNDIDSLRTYVIDAVLVHHGDAAIELEQEGHIPPGRVDESVQRYEQALSVIDEYRAFLCRMSEVVDLAGSLESVTPGGGGSQASGQVRAENS